MWRKQSEGKPSSSSPGWSEPASYAPPAARTPDAGAAAPLNVASASLLPSDASLLTKGIRIKGTLTGKGELTIDGEIVGAIRLGDSRVAVGPNGIVKADIEARDVSVRGTVEGNLRGRERVLLGDTGDVKGNIESERVAIEDGARFRGRVEMNRPGESHSDRAIPKKTASSLNISSPVPAPIPARVSISAKESISTAEPVEVPGSSH